MKNLRLASLALLALTTTTKSPFLVGAFAPTTATATTTTTTSQTALLLSSSSSSSSRFEGNQRLPSAQEVALMDEMIDKLAAAKPYELPSAVKRAFRIVRSPRFFLRIAQRTDEATTSAQEREQLTALATNLVRTLEVVVETTSEQLDERAADVQRVVQAAAEPNDGEFLVPLSASRLSDMRAALANLPPSNLDEGFLATVDSWIVKSHSDGMDLMVGILQKVLQLYAGLQITRYMEQTNEWDQNDDGDDDADNDTVTKEMKQLLAMDAEQWANQIAAMTDVSALKKQVQKTMEKVVLSLETGSMAQQVQAEYLKELLKRVEEAEQA